MQCVVMYILTKGGIMEKTVCSDTIEKGLNKMYDRGFADGYNSRQGIGFQISSNSIIAEIAAREKYKFVDKILIASIVDDVVEIVNSKK